MAGNNVKLVQSIDDREVVQAWERQIKLLDRIESKLEKTGQKGAAAGEKGASAAEKFSGTLVKVGAAIGGITSVAETLRAELEKVKRLESEFQQSQVSAGESIRRAKLFFTPDASVGRNEFESRIQGIQAATGANVPTVSRALETALSAKGEQSNAVAFSAVEQALRIDPKGGEQAATLSGAFLDLAKITGVQDIRANAGFLQQVQSSARVTSLSAAGQNLVPAIGSLTDLGDSPEQAAELVAALTQLTSDPTGASSGTAATNLAVQLEKFVGQRSGKDERGAFRVPADQIAAFDAAGSTSERISVLQESPELRRQFVGGASFEAKSRQAVIGLLSNEGRAAGALEAAQRGIGPAGDDSIAAFEQILGFLNQGTFDPLRDFDKGTDAAFERTDLDGSLEARRAAVRQILETSREKFDFLGPDSVPLPLLGDVGSSQFGLMEFEARQKLTSESPEQSGIGILQRQSESFRFQDDPRAQQLLTELIDTLQNLEAQVRENTDATREDVDAIREQARGSGAEAPPEAALGRAD